MNIDDQNQEDRPRYRARPVRHEPNGLAQSGSGCPVTGISATAPTKWSSVPTLIGDQQGTGWPRRSAARHRDPGTMRNSREWTRLGVARKEGRGFDLPLKYRSLLCKQGKSGQKPGKPRLRRSGLAWRGGKMTPIAAVALLSGGREGAIASGRAVVARRGRRLRSAAQPRFSLRVRVAQPRDG